MVHELLISAKEKGLKQIAILLDPDKCKKSSLKNLIKRAVDAQIDYFFVGSSILLRNEMDSLIKEIKNSCEIPVVIFPGNGAQLSQHADAVLFLTLISGRNPEYLIGQQVVAAPMVKRMGLEAIGTGYMVIEGGRTTSVSYISNTKPIPRDKVDIAMATAMAGEFIGNKLIYMDAGSGPLFPVPVDLIKGVSETINIPLIIGGGIKTKKSIATAFEAGADVVVVGTKVEEDVEFLNEIKDYKHKSWK